MDYQHPHAAAYFPGAQTYHQFIGMSPLTPSHYNSGPSEEFNSTPPEVLTEYTPREQFQTFEPYPAPFGQLPHSQPHRGFPRPPTPPKPSIHGNAHVGRIINGSAVGAGVRVDIPPRLHVPKEEMVEQPVHPQALSATSNNSNANHYHRAGSNSGDEDDNAPGMNKRKAQNRAAQRAFRERKERHVKDLETKLASLEAAQQQATTENEKLKRDLQKVSTENEILRATSAVSASGGSPRSHGSPPLEAGPMTFQPTDFYKDLLDGHANKTFTHRVSTSSEGEKLYDAGSTWDLIINHELYQQGLIDVAHISQSLKGLAKCDGQGPVFRQSDILAAIEQSVSNASDTLL